MTKKTPFGRIKTSRKHDTILEVHLTSTSIGGVLRIFRSKLAAREKYYVVTPNPEIILAAQKDTRLKKILNSADISLPDGIGLAQAAKFLGFKSPQNFLLRIVVLFFRGISVGLATFFNRDWLTSALKPIPGRVMFMQLMGLANKKGLRVFFLGDKNVHHAKEALTRSFKMVKIEAAQGPWLDLEGNPTSADERQREEECIDRINKFGPHILFVGFNAPKQEKWLYKWLPKLNTPAGMVVGGTFDYFSGIADLPPKWMETLGLEWLWRSVRQPWRAGRIIKAVFVFPFLVYISKIKEK